MIRCNANLFRIAFLCASKEETRYYLQGVYVQPHASVGVTLAVTDGHRLMVIHDETGHADESVIVKLTPDALKACKSKKGERRDLVIHNGDKDATICTTIEETNGTLTDSRVAVSLNCRIDGTYPDWHRVVPQKFKPESAPTFNGIYLGDFGKIGNELAAHSGTSRVAPMRVVPGNGDVGSPALVRWIGIPYAFGILMPMRGNDLENDAPDWFRAPVKAPAIAPDATQERAVETAE